MAMRLIMAIAVLTVFAGCLKNTADESAYMEPAVTEEAAAGNAADISHEIQPVQGKSVSVEPAAAGVSETPSVRDIQQALKNADLYTGKIDGILGPNTRKAIESFQSQNNLKADGKVGPKTWQKLKEYLAK